MEFFWIILGILLFLLIAALIIAYICFRIAFYVPPKKRRLVKIPDGEIYKPYKETIENWIKSLNELNPKEFSITSFDGLTLYGKYYEFSPGAPIELMFHGYRSNAESDLSGGVERCFKLGRSAFIVSQRCSSKSDGKVITFGIKEHRDCLSWVDFLVSHFGSDVKIILTGISMGASTVLIAAGQRLPENVMGVLADCGFTSAKDIIGKVINDMRLPVGICYPFVKLGARLFGHFNLEETSALEAVRKSTVPIIFFHGKNDDYVPCDMSVELFNACASKKQLITVEGAGHGLCYPVDPKLYLDSLRTFFNN